MKLEKPINPNYCATVVKLKIINRLEGSDNIVGTPLFGFQAIVSKEHQVGDIGVLFPAETRLSNKYCEQNNLFRHTELNKDPDQGGYIEDSRRVKAIKFRGNRSDCLFMPLQSLEWTGINISQLKEGDEFDHLNGELICEKYERPVHLSRTERMVAKVFKRVDKKFLPEHYDNENYFKNERAIFDETTLVVTQKLHGTSIRVGNTIVLRKPGLRDKLAKLLGVQIKESEFDYVFGSRRVIKDVNNPNQIHYYGEDIWTTEGKKLQGLIPENYLVYGELCGWVPTGAAIQKDYTYRIPEGLCTLFVYRVAVVNAQGVLSDLSWDHVKEFCIARGLFTVPELWRGKKKDFDPYIFLDRRFADDKKGSYTDIPISLEENKNLVDEGVCIRIDTLIPLILKAKSPISLQHETELIDEGVEDIEADQSASEGI